MSKYILGKLHRRPQSSMKRLCHFAWFSHQNSRVSRTYRKSTLVWQNCSCVFIFFSFSSISGFSKKFPAISELLSQAVPDGTQKTKTKKLDFCFLFFDFTQQMDTKNVEKQKSRFLCIFCFCRARWEIKIKKAKNKVTLSHTTFLFFVFCFLLPIWHVIEHQKTKNQIFGF